MVTAKRILLVEDEEMIRDLYARHLREAGYDVSEVGDGEEAYTAILKGNYDLVLLDIMIPSFSGTSILRTLKADPSAKNLKCKIVMLTNLDQESVKDESAYYGVDGYLVKNQIDVLHLADEIKKYLE